LSFEVGRDVAEQRMSALLQSQPGGADFQTIYDEQMTRFQQAIELKSKFEELFLMNRQGQVVLSTDVEQKDKIYSNQTQ
jgi:predicted secreted protein